MILCISNGFFRPSLLLVYSWLTCLLYWAVICTSMYKSVGYSMVWWPAPAMVHKPPALFGWGATQLKQAAHKLETYNNNCEMALGC